MLDNINFMDNLNAKWNIEQVNIIFDMFHVVFLNWIPKSWLSFWTILHRRTDFSLVSRSKSELNYKIFQDQGKRWHLNMPIWHTCQHLRNPKRDIWSESFSSQDRITESPLVGTRDMHPGFFLYIFSWCIFRARIFTIKLVKICIKTR